MNRILGVTHTMPITLGLVMALGAFGGWVYLLIRAQREATSPVDALGLVVAHSAPAEFRAPRAEPTVHVAAAEDGRESHDSTPQLVVRAGSFCRRPGATATTEIGTAMVCSAVGDSRPRWRRSRPALERSA